MSICRVKPPGAADAVGLEDFQTGIGEMPQIIYGVDRACPIAICFTATATSGGNLYNNRVPCDSSSGRSSNCAIADAKSSPIFVDALLSNQISESNVQVNLRRSAKRVGITLGMKMPEHSKCWRPG